MLHTKLVEKMTAHILYSISFSENRAVYEIMWKNMVEPDMTKITMYYGKCVLHAG